MIDNEKMKEFRDRMRGTAPSSFTVDNIYTGTPDTFEDINPQQQPALYEKTPNTFKRISFEDKLIGRKNLSKALVNKLRREKCMEKKEKSENEVFEHTLFDKI